jgi:hypothetical protein
MAKLVRCTKCGGAAVLEFVRIPKYDRELDGTLRHPDNWICEVNCPRCGLREQPAGGRKERRTSRVDPSREVAS